VKPTARAPRVLPVRVERESAVVEAQSGSLRVIFRKRIYLRETLACRCGHIVTAKAPDRVGEKTRYAPGFVAHLIVNKCGDSNPQYRLEKAYRNLGIPVSRSTLCGLIHRGAAELKPLHSAALKHVPQAPDVHADETSMRQQDLEKRSFIWSFVTPELTVYRYATRLRSAVSLCHAAGSSFGTRTRNRRRL